MGEHARHTRPSPASERSPLPPIDSRPASAYTPNMSSRRWDVWAILFFLLALLTSAARLSATAWAEYLELAVLLALLGAWLGLALGISRFRPWLVAALAGGYTLFLLPWVLGIGQYPALDWTSRLLAMLERSQRAIVTLTARQPLEDTFLFLALVSLAYWLVGLIGGFSLTRRNDFALAALPAGLALLIIHAFDRHHPGTSAYLFIYLLASLLLLARLYFLHRYADWQQARVHLPAEAARDWNLAVLLTVAFTVALAWFLPAPAQAIGFAQRAWRRLTPDWQNRETDFSRLVAGLRTGNLAAPYAGETLTLEPNAATGSGVVFTVHLPPVNQTPRYYWRARVYDFYDDGQWQTRDVTVRHFSPAEIPLSLPNALGTLATYTFTVQMPSEWLFTPPRARWINLPARVGLTPIPPEGMEPLFFQAALNAGQEYQVQAFDFSPTEAQLRAAGQNYPSWVNERYLQLPANLSPRVRALAAALTANAPTPYDKAQAITDWLRASIRYSEHVPPPPAGQEMLEWLLFDSRQGFCTYTATAEVILLRAAGVPARLAVGYAEGEIPPGTLRTRLVRQSHAHAWPEAYFPGIGWVEFEPTAIQSPLRRPAGEAENDALPLARATPVPPPVTTPVANESIERPLPKRIFSSARQPGFWIGTAVVLGMVALLSGLLLRARHRQRNAVPWLLRLYVGLSQRGRALPPWLHRWARRRAQTPIQRACAELYHAARRLGANLSPAQTPLEIASQLRSLFPEAIPEIDALLDACLPALYGPETGDWRAARAAAISLRRKSRRAAWQKRLHMR